MSDALPLDLDPAAEPELPVAKEPPGPPPARLGIPETQGGNVPTDIVPWDEPPPAEVDAYRAYDPTGASLQELGDIGRVFAKSGYFKDARDAAQCITKILAGRELGIGPFQAVSQFHVVEGKPTMSASLIGAMVKRSGKYDYLPKTWNDQECVLEWYQDRTVVGESSFSIADAQRAKIYKNAWLTYPKAMLQARALTQGARMYCPDVFGGVIYAEGELEG